jgi:hypothetical protein
LLSETSKIRCDGSWQVMPVWHNILNLAGFDNKQILFPCRDLGAYMTLGLAVVDQLVFGLTSLDFRIIIN